MEALLQQEGMNKIATHIHIVQQQQQQPHSLDCDTLDHVVCITASICANAGPVLVSILVFLHNRRPAARASHHASAAEHKTDPASWKRLTNNFAAVVDMYISEEDLPDCEQNHSAIRGIVSIITGTGNPA